MKELGSLLPLCGHCSEFSSVTDAFSDLAVISKGKGSSGVDALYSMMLSEKTSTCNHLEWWPSLSPCRINFSYKRFFLTYS